MKKDTLLGLILMIFSIIFYYMAKSFPRKDALLPNFAIYGILILSLILIITSINNKNNDYLRLIKLKIFNNNTTKIFFLTVIYLVLLPYIGYFLATFLFSILAMKVLKIKNSLIIKTTIGYILLSWLFFVKALSVPLPIGLLFTSLM